MDIMKGLLSISDYSIKTAKGNKVDCGDVLRRREEQNYNLVVGVYSQCDDYKVFHTEYTFFIRPEHERKTERTVLKNCIEDKNALIKIHPKVDSKKQRRVQCSLKISELMTSGIEYKVTAIREFVQSPSRKFNK